MIPLHEPTFDEADETAVVETLRSAWVSTGGPKVTEFEAQFAEYVGVEHAVSVCNGTVGLSLALTVLARERKIMGSFMVLVPNLTFIATANAVVQAGGVPVFFDTAPECLNAGLAQIQASLSKNFKQDPAEHGWRHKESQLPLLAIMPAHIMGWGGEILKIAQFCQENQIPLIEDAAESLGSRHLSGEHFGKLGSMTVFSFNGNKILTTGGGGMVVTRSAHLAHRIKHLSTTAKTDGFRFEHDEVGFNYRLVNILAALGCSQLQKLNGRLDLKAEIFKNYQRHLSSTPLKLYQETQCHPNHWLVNVVCESLEQRERILSHLNEHKVQARPIWKLNHTQPALKSFCDSRNDGDYPNSIEMWKKVVSLPSSPHLTSGQIEFISGHIINALN